MGRRQRCRLPVADGAGKLAGSKGSVSRVTSSAVVTGPSPLALRVVRIRTHGLLIRICEAVGVTINSGGTRVGKFVVTSTPSSDPRLTSLSATASGKPPSEMPSPLVSHGEDQSHPQRARRHARGRRRPCPRSPQPAVEIDFITIRHAVAVGSGGPGLHSSRPGGVRDWFR